jgi:cytochrome c biogenesis protein CcdA
MSVIWLRIIIGVLLIAVVLVAVVPLLVLLDLAGGGGGYGVCPGGLGECEIPYTAWLELAAALVLMIFGLIALLRLTMKVVRREERRRQALERISGFNGPA